MQYNTPEAMRDLVRFVGALQEYRSQFSLGGMLATMIAEVAQNPELPPTVMVFPQELREFQLELLGLEYGTVANRVGISDAGRFAEFVTEATLHSPDEAFAAAIHDIATQHAHHLAGLLREDADLQWDVLWGHLELANALTNYGDGLASTREALRALAIHGLDGTGNAFVRALDAGLYIEISEHTHGLHNLHEDISGDGLLRRWHAVFYAIDGCPSTPAGRQLRSDLTNRAHERFNAAMEDRAAHFEQNPNAALTPYFIDHAAPYQRIGQQLAQRSPDLEPPGGHSLA